MVIPKDIQEDWNNLFTAGDPDKISEGMPEDKRVSAQTIRRAYEQTTCSDEVFGAVASFYQNKVNSLEPFLRTSLKYYGKTSEPAA